ncbi:Uncharacterised protein [Streptococcus pneumoniae]|nr:hypothetical protein GPS_INP33_ICESp14ST230_32 [Streptococcus pneumoniae]AWW22593.1 hypothetical protein GPS_ZA808_ICESp14ST230_32 [Streptococcus pneumoniae]AWW22668.1 hypothetical protein GPS_ZA1599_ICESp14ST230_32 [Streptococcus pneumoniae]AWW22927.1 hypothetical protein PMEN32_ICESp14ST230_32 [Streptococcus pneumoniae]CEW81118.1 Uncharacterised protein [Streptococcus pneumoniae]
MNTDTSKVVVDNTSEDMDISILNFKEVDIAYTAHEPGRC